MPPNTWRSPDDLSDIDTPDGLYCKLPQDSPMAVRGARNYPCMGHPGKRAPTVEICNSDKPFMPLAMRQHTLGPYPLDPNLLAQGVPPDDRITSNDRIFGPLEGTPLPPGAVPRGTPAGPRGENPPPGTVGAAVSAGAVVGTDGWRPYRQCRLTFRPMRHSTSLHREQLPPPPAAPAPPPPPAAPAPPDQVDGGQPQAAPSSFGANASKPAPSVVVAKYDPHTGRYVGPDGKLYQQSDLVPPTAPKTWKDMLPS